MAAMTTTGNLSVLSVEAREHIRKDARRIAFKSRLPEIAEDLEIEGIAAYVRRPADDPSDVDSQGTARNRAWNAMWNLARRKMRRRFHGSVDLMASYRLHEEGRSFAGAERPDLDLLEEVMSALPDRGKRIARAVFIQNMTQEAVAAEMGISQGTVSRCLNQCIPVIAQKYLERSA
jgi:RNA polymerase sigma factor (sigma-70 family)